MTTPELKTIETALKTRAKELSRSLAERNQITIERSADVFDATLLAAERESSARALEQEFRLFRQVEAARNRYNNHTEVLSSPPSSISSSTSTVKISPP